MPSHSSPFTRLSEKTLSCDLLIRVEVSMKVEVTMKMKTQADTNLSVTVGASETVAGLKERLAGLQMIPFPDQDLVFDGNVLSDVSKLSACGVGDGAALELAIKASEATLVGQLVELLQARALSADELGLLYCYKHGVAVGQALKMLGFEGKLQDFLKNEKKFLLDGGRVSLVREDAATKPSSNVDEAEENSTDAKSCVYSIASLLEMRLWLMTKEPEVFALNGNSAGCLKSAIVPQAANEPEPAKEPEEPKELVSLPPGLEDDESQVDEPKPWSPDSEQYMDLHNRISSRSFNSKTARTLNDVVELVKENICFTVSHHVKGGSVGKGTAINYCKDAAVIFFLAGLPPKMHESWLQPLLKSVVGILSQNLDSMQTLKIVDDCVQVCMQDLTVDLYFSPVFQTYKDTIKTMSAQSPQERKLYATSLAKENVQFIARQPSEVKITMRLIKWWREQQEWSSEHNRPSDEILELMCVYSAVQTKPEDQRMAVANVMSLFSRFNEMRIVWSNYYSKEEVWTPLLRQRPLLMNPTNPFVNVADPKSFDGCELMEKAKSTYFFW